MSKQPPPAPTASTIGPCPTVFQVSRTPRLWDISKGLKNKFEIAAVIRATEVHCIYSRLTTYVILGRYLRHSTYEVDLSASFRIFICSE